MLPEYRERDISMARSLKAIEVEVLLKVGAGRAIGNLQKHRNAARTLQSKGLLSRSFGELHLTFSGQDCAAWAQRQIKRGGPCLKIKETNAITS